MERDLLIYGAGGAGRELAFSLSLATTPDSWNVKGFVDDDSSLWGQALNNVPVLGGKEWLKNKGGNVAICAVSDPRKKAALVRDLEASKDIGFPLVIAPGSYVSDYIQWGRGCLVAHAFNYITVNINVGDFVFINCGNGIGHDVTIGDYSTIYSHIDISGGVTIGRYCVIGSGVTINPGVTIGDNVVVGAGSVVVKDIPSNVTIAGVPAKVIREREALTPEE